eukprot:7005062-Alexandrium_andersonii.AAC.1
MLCESAELAPELFGEDKPFGGASERPPSGKRPRVSGSPVKFRAVQLSSRLHHSAPSEHEFRVLSDD